MLPVSPPEHPAHFAGVTKNGNVASDSIPSKIDTSTVLIAAVEENEPVVTRRELWSYYRA